MIVLLLPSLRARNYHTTNCCVIQRSAPHGLGCERVDVHEAQRKGFKWCGQCKRSELVVA